jgi:hypothetical protein
MIQAFKPLTVKQLYTVEIPEPEWLVDGLIQDSTLSLLAAREKSGKGLLTIDLVASVAEGSNFLGRETKQGTAIYCATEETLAEVRSRVLHRIGDVDDPPPVMILPLDGTTGDTLDITRPESVDRLRATFEEHRPRLVVIDVLREIHDRKEDSSDEMAPILKVLRNLTRPQGPAIVLNHHMSKGGESRGSTAISGGVDVTMSLQSNTEDLLGSSLGGVLTVRGRSVPKQQLSVRFGADGRWTATGDPAPRAGRILARQRILETLLQSAEELSVKEIAEKTGLAESTVNNVLRGLKSDQPPLVTEKSSGRQGGALLYSVTPAGAAAA